jgi:hypothetical protein
MQFLHTRKYLNAGALVIVDCDHQCNVRVLDDPNFGSYRSGRRHTYFGGFYHQLPARISVPHSGWWNVALDLGGGSANIRHSITYMEA